MIIYLDYVFIENFLIDYILLKETAYIARQQVAKTNTIVSAIVSSLYIVIMMYFKIAQLNYVLCKMLLVVIMIYICFKPKITSEYIKLIALFFLISVVNIGCIIFITNILNIKQINLIIKISIYMVSMYLGNLFIHYIWKFYSREIKNNDLIYKVKIRLGNKTYKYNAFLDTGNNVFSYTYNVPVIFAEILSEDILQQLKNNQSFYIRTVTLSNQTNKLAYMFEKIEISKGDKTWLVNAAIVFENTKLSKDNSYNMLLNYILYTHELGGIKI